MENRAHALAAGLFSLFLGAAVIAAIWWFSDDSAPVRRYLLVSNGNITGLNIQAQVRFRGIQAGKVESIRINADNPREILVQISLRDDLPVTRGTTASLGYQGVTGLAFVQLEDRGADPAPLVANGPGLPRIELQPGLIDKASDIALETLNRIGSASEKLVLLLSGENMKRVESILGRLESASARVDGSLAVLPEIMANVNSLLSQENLGQFKTVLSNLEKTTEEAGPAVKEFRSLIVRIDESAASIDRFTETVGDGLMTSSLPRLNALLQELTATSRQLSSLFQELEASPQMLILGRGHQEPGPGEPGFEAPRLFGSREGGNK
ncbi:MAG: MCE family protein [Rhodocyclaceae bacterium]|nr:MCE family protein [Rhodocyclaceae bacterium]MCP5308956.1 MCE family protein [Zoogloeaceae bacterium]